MFLKSVREVRSINKNIQIILAVVKKKELCKLSWIIISFYTAPMPPRPDMNFRYEYSKKKNILIRNVETSIFHIRRGRYIIKPYPILGSNQRRFFFFFLNRKRKIKILNNYTYCIVCFERPSLLNFQFFFCLSHVQLYRGFLEVYTPNEQTSSKSHGSREFRPERRISWSTGTPNKFLAAESETAQHTPSTTCT
jgi:hypothetical protein